LALRLQKGRWKR